MLAALPLGEDLVGRCVVTLWSRASPYLRVGVGRSGSTGGSPFAIEFFLTGIGRLSGWRRGLGSRLHGAASVWGRVHLHKVLLPPPPLLLLLLRLTLLSERTRN